MLHVLNHRGLLFTYRPEFGGTVPIFHFVSRVLNYPENVPHFTSCPYFHKKLNAITVLSGLFLILVQCSYYFTTFPADSDLF